MLPLPNPVHGKRPPGIGAGEVIGLLISTDHVLREQVAGAFLIVKPACHRRIVGLARLASPLMVFVDSVYGFLCRCPAPVALDPKDREKTKTLINRRRADAQIIDQYRAVVEAVLHGDVTAAGLADVAGRIEATALQRVGIEGHDPAEDRGHVVVAAVFAEDLVEHCVITGRHIHVTAGPVITRIDLCLVGSLDHGQVLLVWVKSKESGGGGEQVPSKATRDSPASP